jgi:hypothetical protein
MQRDVGYHSASSTKLCWLAAVILLAVSEQVLLTQLARFFKRYLHGSPTASDRSMLRCAMSASLRHAHGRQQASPFSCLNAGGLMPQEVHLAGKDVM